MAKSEPTRFEEGMKVFMEYLDATLGKQKAQKAEVDAQNLVQSAGTKEVAARRDWERWMAEAPVLVVENILLETLRKLEEK